MKFILSLLLMTSIAGAYETRDDMIQGCRQEIMKKAQKNKDLIYAPIESNDLPEELVDEPEKMIRRPKEMEEKGLISGSAKVIPWSDSYWPMFRGGLGQRYNDEEFMSYEWKEANEYIHSRPASALIEEGKLDSLSPAEKYDHLLGLTDFPLTASQWTDGQQFFNRSGRVESWMGLCHGWAPASMMMPEPKKKISLGGMNFYPSDIKGLATLMWARGNFPTRFIGGRCNAQDPQSDRNGRPTEQNCLDNNPGSWHLVVVNQLGISKRPFIMDASYDYQVWNHPVYSYQYVYFNPRTMTDGKFNESLEKSGNWDKRKHLRARDTKTIVGVRMTVTYAVENEPSMEEDQNSDSSRVSYDYDLELNQNGEIIGGEWHSHGHPDFLWVPDPDSFPRTVGDQVQVNLTHLTREIKDTARKGAIRGLPMGNLVKSLVKASARKDR